MNISTCSLYTCTDIVYTFSLLESVHFSPLSLYIYVQSFILSTNFQVKKKRKKTFPFNIAAMFTLFCF